MTTIATIVKANATTLTTACGIVATSTSKGVPGQFDKLVDLINQLPEGEFFIEAEKIKGVFKALGENSKDSTTFKFVLACKGWELVQVEKDVWFICRPEGDIVLINGSYVEPTQPEEVEMEVIEDDFNFKCLPFKKQADINCLLAQIGGKAFPESLSDIEDSIFKSSWKEDEKTQQAIQELEDIVRQYRPSQIKEKVKTYPVIVYSEVSIETDQGLKVAKYLPTDTGIVTCKGTEFESIEALVNAVKAAFKVETQEVSETTQEVVMKTFVDLMKEAWIPSRETWVAQTLINKMRTTWTSGKYPTDENQKIFMKAFVAQVETLPQGVEMPARAFLTAYDMVVEQLTGVKTQLEVPKELKVVEKDHLEEEVHDAYTAHLDTLLSKFQDKSTTYVPPVKEKITQVVVPSIDRSKEFVCPNGGKLITIECWEDHAIIPNDEGTGYEIGDAYPSFVASFKDSINTIFKDGVAFRSGEDIWNVCTWYFNEVSSISRLKGVEILGNATLEEIKEEGVNLGTDNTEYQVGDILAVTYDDEHNEYAYYGSESITVKAIVVEGGFQLGEGEDAEVFATIHELCCKASNGNYEGTPQVRVVTEEEIEAILEKEYNIGMGIE